MKAHQHPRLFWPSVRLLGALAFVLCVAGFLIAAKSAPPQAQALKDAETCGACHEAVVKAFPQEPHAAVSPASCTSCHLGSETHLQEGGGATILAFKASDPAHKKTQPCLTCHEEASQASFLGGMHARRGVDCTSCHSVHNSKSKEDMLRTSTESATCFTCHKSYRAKSQRSSHHPIFEGKMSCVSCHNPHDGTNPKMVTANSVNEKCYECHAEKRGPFLHEHAPVRENCLSCHDPHGSNHDKLLQAKQPYLCQRCHFGGGHPGNLYDRSNTLAGPPVAPPNGTTISSRAVERECKNCHSQIHGSNSFSGVVFGR